MDTRGSSYEAPGSQICSKKKRGDSENRGRRQGEHSRKVKLRNQEHVHQKDSYENCDINAATHDENFLMLSKLSPNMLRFLQSGGKLDVNLMHTSDRRCSASQIGDARDGLMQQQNMELASRFLRFHIKVFIQSWLVKILTLRLRVFKAEVLRRERNAKTPAGNKTQNVYFSKFISGSCFP